MTRILEVLIAEARGLALDHPCKLEHLWESEGGRACPHDIAGAGGCGGSQTVYRCARCGQYDYGERGGPGWLDCSSSGAFGCGRELTGLE